MLGATEHSPTVMGSTLLILHHLFYLLVASGLAPAWCSAIALLLCCCYQSEMGKTQLPKIKKLFIKQRPEVFFYYLLSALQVFKDYS